jgi:hypothetical protein
MKILSYTGYRTGSRSFGEWLSIELDLPYYHEPFNPKFLLNPFNPKFDKNNFLTEDIDDCIIKIPPVDGFDYESLKKLFDKTIILYRENTREQAESAIWAYEKKLWHHDWNAVTYNSTFKPNSFTSAHYTIPQEWLDKNAESIKYMEEDLQKENELLKSLTDCLHITYEELYYSDNGIKKIEDYIGFKSKTKFSKIHKLRNGFIKKSLT